MHELFGKIQLIKHFRAAREECDGTAMLVLRRFRVLLDDFDLVGGTREVASELVGGYETWSC